MKLLNTVMALALTCPVFAQVKIIPNQETTVGSGIFIEAEMTPTDIEFTITGPSDRWFAIGIGSVMSNADAIIYTGGKVGAMHTEGVWDYDLNAQNANGVNKDATDNLTVISNTVNAGQRTIVVSRLLNTGDALDHTINFNDPSLNIIWARGNTADYTLSYHGGNRGPAILAWQTPDITPPAIAGAFSPADNEIDVNLATNCVVTFDEDIAFGTGMIELRELNGGAIVEQFDVASPNGISIAGPQLTINPTANLSPITEYYITIANGAIEDLAGNAYVGFTDNATWNFTTLDNTGDVTPPTIASNTFSPADDAQGVSTATNLSVDFSEDIAPGVGMVYLFDNTQGGVQESFDVTTSPNLNFNGITLTITPSQTLTFNNGYFVTIDSAAVEDLAGNPFAGFVDSTTWNFTTEVNGLQELSSNFSIDLIDANSFLLEEKSGLVFDISVYNAAGQELYTMDKASTQVRIELDHQASQVVYLIVTAEGVRYQKKMYLHE